MTSADVDVERVPGRLRLAVAGDYLLSHLGYFTVAPVLAAVLIGTGDAAWAGVALFGFSLAMRGGSLVMVPVITRLRFRPGIVGGLLVASVAFALLGLPLPVAAQVALLVLAGCGISLNGTMVRLYIATSLRRASNRHRVFTLVQITVNVAAAVGPVIGNVLLDAPRWQLFGTVAVAYATAGVVVAGLLPRDARPDPTGVRSPLRPATLRAALAQPHVRVAMGLTVLGGFLYAQLFSGLALEIVAGLDDPVLRASVFVVNAVLVVALQVPVTAWVARLLDRGVLPVHVLCAGLLLFCAAFAVLGATGGTIASFLAVIVLFSLGETFYTPTVDTAFTSLDPRRNPLELINLRQVSVALGESSGALAGSGIALLSGTGTGGGWPWYVLAALGAAGAVVLGRRASLHRRSADAATSSVPASTRRKD